MGSLSKIDCIGKISVQKLSWAGIETTDELLKRGATVRGRQIISGETGLSSKRILEWVDHVNLLRLKGIGEDYAILLNEAGVYSVIELAQSDPDTLSERIEHINREKNIVRRQPSLAVIKRWIKDAQQLPRLIEY